MGANAASEEKYAMKSRPFMTCSQRARGSEILSLVPLAIVLLVPYVGCNTTFTFDSYVCGTAQTERYFLEE